MSPRRAGIGVHLPMGLCCFTLEKCGAPALFIPTSTTSFTLSHNTVRLRSVGIDDATIESSGSSREFWNNRRGNQFSSCSDYHRLYEFQTSRWRVGATHSSSPFSGGITAERTTHQPGVSLRVTPAVDGWQIMSPVFLRCTDPGAVHSPVADYD